MKVIPRHRFFFSMQWLWDFLLLKKRSAASVVKHEIQRWSGNGDVYLFSSARGAFRFLLENLDLDKDAVFLIPEYGFYVFSPIIKSLGYSVKLAPVKENLLLDEEKIRELLPSCSVLIVSNLFSRCPDLIQIRDLCRENGVILIHDNVHSFGCFFQQRPFSEYADYSLFSFGTGKHLPAFGGGALISRKKTFDGYEKLPQAADQSLLPGLMEYFFTLPFIFVLLVFPVFLLLNLFSRDFLEGLFMEKKEQYSLPESRKISSISLFLLERQLFRYSQCRRKRKKLQNIYKTGLEKMNISIPAQAPGLDSDPLIFQIFLSDSLIRHLLFRGIDCRYDFCEFENKNHCLQRSVYLPLYADLTEKEIKYTLNIIRNWVRKNC